MSITVNMSNALETTNAARNLCKTLCFAEQCASLLDEHSKPHVRRSLIKYAELTRRFRTLSARDHQNPYQFTPPRADETPKAAILFWQILRASTWTRIHELLLRLDQEQATPPDATQQQLIHQAREEEAFYNVSMYLQRIIVDSVKQAGEPSSTT